MDMFKRLIITFGSLTLASCGLSTSRPQPCKVGYAPPAVYSSEFNRDVGKLLLRAAVNAKDNTAESDNDVSFGIQRSLHERLTSNLLLENQELPNCVTGDLRALVLSTGGAWGAFGAGFLEAISKSDTAYFENCPYDLVTGSSTGAIIAPFAFLGTVKDLEKASQIYREELPRDNLLTRRGLFGAFKRGALFDTTELKETVRDTLSDPELNLVERIGQEADNNRLLLVSAVNVDSGHVEIFDLTAIANESRPETDKIDAMADAITASAAIPIAFDPVTIDGCLYQDAALRTNAFITGELAAVVLEENSAEVSVRDSRLGGNEFVIDVANVLPKYTVGIDLIVNGNPAVNNWSAVEEYNIGSVALRNVEILLNQSMYSSIGRIRDTAASLDWQLRYQDAFDYPNRPAASPLSAGGKAFDQEFIVELNEFGFKVGKENDESKRWKEAPSPAAPLDF